MFNWRDGIMYSYMYYKKNTYIFYMQSTAIYHDLPEYFIALLNIFHISETCYYVWNKSTTGF